MVRLLEIHDFDPSIKEAIDQDAGLGRNFWRRLVLPPIKCWSLTSLHQRLVKMRGYYYVEGHLTCRLSTTCCGESGRYRSRQAGSVAQCKIRLAKKGISAEQRLRNVLKAGTPWGARQGGLRRRAPKPDDCGTKNCSCALGNRVYLKPIRPEKAETQG